MTTLVWTAPLTFVLGAALACVFAMLRLDLPDFGDFGLLGLLALAVFCGMVDTLSRRRGT